MEESHAIKRLQRGDLGGLEFLVCHYQVRALRSAYLVTRDLALAEDVVQAAFLKASQRIGQFDASRSFGPWFLTSVLHDAIKAARKRDRLTSLEGILEDDLSPRADPLVDREQDPEVLWQQAETAEEVWAALRRLTPDQRAAVVARYFLGLSEAEMSAALDCPPSTVKWRLHAARQRLRLILRPATE